MLACVLVVVVVGSVGTAGQEGPVVSVTRGGVEDVFTISSPDGAYNRSCADYKTYMVEEDVCREDTDLQMKCSVHLAPVSYSDNVVTTASISVSIADNGSLLVLNDANNTFEEARLLNRQNISQNDGGKACRVTGLDVVRGEDCTRQIDHTGFSVNSDSESFDIKVHVNKNSLPYEEMDYEGELYRMNISCEMNQNVDCVFFKLVGTTNLTGEKFNGTITSCPLPTTPPPTTTPLTTSTPTTDTADTTTDQPGQGILDDILIYIIIGSSIGIVLLLCLITTLCCAICCMSAKNRRRVVPSIRETDLAEPEDHYQLRNPTYNTIRTSEAVEEAENNEGQQQEEEDDHMYAIVEEAQEQAEEVRRKEATRAKFQYASITFNTFKPPTPPPENMTPPTPYQPQPDDEQQQLRDTRLPSFARNHNPASNRAMLARSYEVVAPMLSLAGATNAVTETPPQDEYHKLDRKMSEVSSKRNFSISTPKTDHRVITNYSVLQLSTKPAAAPPTQPTAELAGGELGVKRIKPMIKKRTLLKDENAQNEKPPEKIPSYSLVQKPKAPPLPPHYNRTEEEEEEEESHYKVPVSKKVLLDREAANIYDHPSSLVRVSWSCENIQSNPAPNPRTQMGSFVTNASARPHPSNPRTHAGSFLTNAPVSPHRQRVVCSQHCLAEQREEQEEEEPIYNNYLLSRGGHHASHDNGRLSHDNGRVMYDNSASMESYIDMLGNEFDSHV